MSIWPHPWEFCKGSKPLWFPLSAHIPFVYKPVYVTTGEASWVWGIIDEVKYVWQCLIVHREGQLKIFIGLAVGTRFMKDPLLPAKKLYAVRMDG